MANKCTTAFENAARSVAKVPDDYGLRIKDNIPNQHDWDELNTKTCAELNKLGCVIVQSELDPFWEGNSTFQEMLNYIYDNCNCEG